MIVMTGDILRETMIDLLKEAYADTYGIKDVRRSVKVLLKHYLTEREYAKWKEEAKSFKSKGDGVPHQDGGEINE